MSLKAKPELHTPGALDVATPSRSHVLTVDVEDYFQVEAFADVISRDSWKHWPSRVVDNTLRILDLFDQCGVKGTFFFLGWVAEHFPRLVREVHGRGHELGCHSYWHRPIYRLSEGEFRSDTRRAKQAIEDAAGAAIHGYRAPSWSLTRKCLWALDILAEEQFLYDSSIYPIRHDLYGIPDAKRFPHLHACRNGLHIQEFPPATIRILGINLPAAGGGYLRVLPQIYTSLAFRLFERQYGQRIVLYFHPWELDPNQPRIAGKLRSRFRHYTGLERMQEIIHGILRRHHFERFCDVLQCGTKHEAHEQGWLPRGEKCEGI